jgi:hypothetical protein
LITEKTYVQMTWKFMYLISGRIEVLSSRIHAAMLSFAKSTSCLLPIFHKRCRTLSAFASAIIYSALPKLSIYLSNFICILSFHLSYEFKYTNSAQAPPSTNSIPPLLCTCTQVDREVSGLYFIEIVSLYLRFLEGSVFLPASFAPHLILNILSDLAFLWPYFSFFCWEG